MPPAAIGPFHIERELGRGGMGEVFLAHDTRLDRQVAIKALPAHLATDPDRLARFQREAKVLASLSHPGIGAIYGLEVADGNQYLVLEFVEGETLADHLARGAMPVDEALSIAKQIAEALEAAHEKGIVHRDLKPGNVMVTPDGVVKVLDFGLARTAEGSPSTTHAPNSPDSPTVTSPARFHSPTIPGAIMGTAGYMSPEQARGKPVDKRSDIFSFGCVLYEMLAGSGPFRGETVTDSLGAILHREPEWSLLSPSTPPRVRELLRSCLAKDRRERLHDIGDARLELQRALAGQEWASAAAPPAVRSGPGRVLIAVAGAVALVGLGWLLASGFSRPAPAAFSQSFHLSTTLPPKPAFSAMVGISPDARFVVYQAWPELDPESDTLPGVLMVRRLDRDETKVIDGTEGARSAALSPDGTWVAFAGVKDRAGTRLDLKKVRLADGQSAGAPVSLCELTPGWPALCWSSDREIAIATQNPAPTILTVSADGGEPRIVLREEGKQDIEGWGALRALPEGKSILATRWSVVGQSMKEQVEVVDLASGTRTVVLQNAARGEYLPGGYLLATRNSNSLVAVRFDPRSASVVGAPVPVLSGAPVDELSASRNGVLALNVRPKGASARRLAWIDDQGRAAPLAGGARPIDAFSVSPDGGRVVSTMVEPEQTEFPSELWVHDLGRQTVRRLSTEGAPLDGAIWSVDGERIAYGVLDDDASAVWMRRVDGTGESVKLFSVPATRTLLFAQSWSPDGTVLAIWRVDIGTNNRDVWMLERGSGPGEWAATPYLDSKADEGAIGFSPDGKWVHFVSDESGRPELYVQRFRPAGSTSSAGPARPNASADRIQVSNAGCGGTSWWGGDGKEIRYLDSDGQIMSVQLKTEPSISVSLPKLLYSIKELKTSRVAFAPDGRLMVVLQGEGERVSKIDLVVNFFDELRAKVEEGK